MQTYITRSGQNIYDICIQLYGSVEGLLDLLAANTSLSVTEYGPQSLVGTSLTIGTKLSRGVILNYHEGAVINSDITNYFTENNKHISNGNHYVYIPDNYAKDVKMIIDHSGLVSNITLKLSSGTLKIDWGDFSDIEVVADKNLHEISHIFKSADNHTVKIYGSFTCDTLDLSSVNGIPYPTSTIYVNNFISNTNKNDLIKTI